MQINLLHWEQSNQLTEEESSYITSLSSLDVQQQNQNIVQANNNNQFEAYVKECKLDDNLIQLQQIQIQYQFKLDQLQNVSSNLQTICEQLRMLNQDKDKIITSIQELHQETSFHINQQRDQMEINYLISENMQYYSNIQKLSQGLEVSDTNETNYQVMMSEIMDGIIFFQSHSHFHNSQKCVEQYLQLKKKLLGICKSALFRILNKESQFISHRFSHFKDLLTIFYPTICCNDNQNSLSSPNPLKLQFLQIVFPQLIPKLSVNDQKNKLIQQYQEEYYKFQITDSLRHFFIYLESQLHKDNDIYLLYNDVFLQYNAFNRYNLHLQINDQLTKQLNAVQQTGSLIYKIKQTLMVDKQEQKQIPYEVLIFETVTGFIFEVFLMEYLYSKIIFTSSIQIIIDNNKQLHNKIIDTYYQTIRLFIQKVSDLEILVQQSEQLLKLQKSIDNFVSQLTSFNFQKMYFSDIIQYLTTQKSQMPQTPESLQKELFANFQELLYVQFIGKLRQDLMHKLVQASQTSIQIKIFQFSAKEYMRMQGKLVIHKYIQQPPIPKGYVLQRNDIYPTVVNGLEIITKMQHCVDEQIFQQLAGEILREINNQLKEVADQFQIKFDSYLFYLKHMIILCDKLSAIGGNYILKESQLDFTETKNILLQLIQGKLKPEISWVELTSTEKLWTHTTNFFSFIYKGMPKLNQFEVDWKSNLINQKNAIQFQFVKDMTFIMAKNLIDFIRKYQYLTHILDENEKDKPEVNLEQANQDLKLLISVPMIKRTYQLFYENFKDFQSEIVLKLNNYLNRELFDKIQVQIAEIIQNSLSLLQQFYIYVSQHYGGKDYDNFNFLSAQEIGQQIRFEYVN